jgi:hypothetical protein
MMNQFSISVTFRQDNYGDIQAVTTAGWSFLDDTADSAAALQRDGLQCVPFD